MKASELSKYLDRLLAIHPDRNILIEFEDRSDDQTFVIDDVVYVSGGRGAEYYTFYMHKLSEGK